MQNRFRQMGFNLGMSLAMFFAGVQRGHAFADSYIANAIAQPTGATGYTISRVSSNGHWIAGNCSLADGSRHPVVWHENVPLILDNISGTAGDAFDVNSSGLVVGQSNNRAFAYDASTATMTSLAASTSWASEARGVNDAGYIVGQAGGYGGFGDQYRAVGWSSPSAGAFDVHGAAGLPNGSFYTGSTGARDISSSGIVGGFIEPNSFHGAFTYNLGTGASWSGEINNLDAEILQFSPDDGTGSLYAIGNWPAARIGGYVYRFTSKEIGNGKLDQTGTFQPLDFAPQGVNASGESVGNFNNDAYIAGFDGLEIRLDTLLVNSASVDLVGGADIFNDGTIAANGVDSGGMLRGYLVTSAPEPSLALTSIALLLGRRRHRRKKPIVDCISFD